MVKKRGLGSWVRRHKFWAVFLGLIIFYALLWSAQAAVERYNYYRVGNQLEDMLATMPHGEKSDRKIENLDACYRSSAKFSAGILRCSAERKATYKLSEFNKPEQIYPEIYDQLSDQSFIKTDSIYASTHLSSSRLDKSLVGNNIVNDVGPEFKLSSNKEFLCSLNIKLVENDSLQITASCTRDARMEYFEVK